MELQKGLSIDSQEMNPQFIETAVKAMVKTPFKGILYGLYRVLVKGLLAPSLIYLIEFS